MRVILGDGEANPKKKPCTFQAWAGGPAESVSLALCAGVRASRTLPELVRVSGSSWELLRGVFGGDATRIAVHQDW